MYCNIIACIQVTQWFSAGVECSGEKLQSTLNQDRILINKCCALAKHWHTLRHYNNNNNTNKLTTSTTTGTAAAVVAGTVHATANVSVTAIDGETGGAVCDDDVSSVLQVLSSQGVFGSYSTASGTEQQQQLEASMMTFDSLAAAAAAMDTQQQVTLLTLHRDSIVHYYNSFK
jgi:hypothetical protein